MIYFVLTPARINVRWTFYSKRIKDKKILDDKKNLLIKKLDH